MPVAAQRVLRAPVLAMRPGPMTVAARARAWARAPGLALGLALGLGSGALAQQAVFLGDVSLSVPAEARFGGLSAIEMAADGLGALVLSDRGTLFTLTLSRDRGRITGAAICCAAAVTGPGGTHLPEAARDSEGLARLPGGRLAISFEGQPHARVALHGADGAETAALPAIPGAGVLPRNGAFEGVAADRAGRIYTVPESMPGRGAIPVLRLQDGRWTRFAELPRGAGWSPVALDIGDDGQLYLLERRASALAGFSSRLTRFALRGDGVGPAQPLLQTSPGTHGNLEGLGIWRDAAGRLIATMVSDDNFLPVLDTTLVEYLLPD